MNSSLQQLLQAFDCVSQPVFFAREGQIIYANAAAQEQLLMPGTPLETLLAVRAWAATAMRCSCRCVWRAACTMP